MTQEELTVDSIRKMETISEAETLRHLKLSLQMPSLLNSLLDRKIVEQTAIKEKIFLTEQELQVAADRFRFERNLISSQATVDWLTKYNLSVTEFEEMVRRNLLWQKLAEHLFKDKAEAYFYAHHLDYYQAVIYQIVLPNFDLAMELFYGIQERELSFWDLAHQYIEDVELRRRGGYLGQKSRDRLRPEVAAAVFSSANRVPQVLKPIAVEKKAYLIYVEEIIQPTLDGSLRQNIIEQLFNNWLSQQRLAASDRLQIDERVAQ